MALSPPNISILECSQHKIRHVQHSSPQSARTLSRAPSSPLANIMYLALPHCSLLHLPPPRACRASPVSGTHRTRPMTQDVAAGLPRWFSLWGPTGGRLLAFAGFCQETVASQHARTQDTEGQPCLDPPISRNVRLVDAWRRYYLEQFGLTLQAMKWCLSRDKSARQGA